MKQSLIDEITTVLQKVPIVNNLARKKFIAQFTIGLIKSRNVQFCEAAHHLDEKVKLASNENRIQDFFRATDLDYFFVATLLISLFPKGPKLRLCIDRTEWDFGTCQVNILMILVGCGDLQIPFYWELSDNQSGNSNVKDRTNLLSFCLQVIGKERIGLVIDDREFVGQAWFKYLKAKELPFVMRDPKHHLITTLEGDQHTVSELVFDVDKPIVFSDCQVDGIWGHAWVKALDEDEFLFLFGSAPLRFMGQFYRKRWTIKACFQNLKNRGFNLELTHLKCLKKVRKLGALMSIAYSFCASLGLYFHRKAQSIKTKKHGHKANNFSRHGLNQILQMCHYQVDMCPDLLLMIRKLFRWIKMQLAHYQAIKIAG